MTTIDLKFDLYQAVKQDEYKITWKNREFVNSKSLYSKKFLPIKTKKNKKTSSFY